MQDITNCVHASDKAWAIKYCCLCLRKDVGIYKNNLACISRSAREVHELANIMEILQCRTDLIICLGTFDEVEVTCNNLYLVDGPARLFFCSRIEGINKRTQ